jgi:hypothetical protein
MAFGRYVLLKGFFTKSFRATDRQSPQRRLADEWRRSVRMAKGRCAGFRGGTRIGRRGAHQILRTNSDFSFIAPMPSILQSMS